MRCTAYKLDGVGPIDIRPSTDKLHQFVQKKKKKRKKKLDGVGHVDNRPSTDDLHYFVKKKKPIKTRITPIRPQITPIRPWTARKQESKLPTDATYNISSLLKYIICTQYNIHNSEN